MCINCAYERTTVIYGIPSLRIPEDVHNGSWYKRKFLLNILIYALVNISKLSNFPIFMINSGSNKDVRF